MAGQWRYALKPLPVDTSVKALAATMSGRERTEAFQRERRASSVVEVSAEERLGRIVRGLRARVSEPEPEERDCGPDVDFSRRN